MSVQVGPEYAALKPKRQTNKEEIKGAVTNAAYLSKKPAVAETVGLHKR